MRPSWMHASSSESCRAACQAAPQQTTTGGRSPLSTTRRVRVGRYTVCSCWASTQLNSWAAQTQVCRGGAHRLHLRPRRVGALRQRGDGRLEHIQHALAQVLGTQLRRPQHATTPLTAGIPSCAIPRGWPLVRAHVQVKDRPEACWGWVQRRARAARHGARRLLARGRGKRRRGGGAT